MGEQGSAAQAEGADGAAHRCKEAPAALPQSTLMDLPTGSMALLVGRWQPPRPRTGQRPSRAAVFSFARRLIRWERASAQASRPLDLWRRRRSASGARPG